MSAQQEDSKGCDSDTLAYVNGRGQAASSNARWALISEKIPTSPQQPRKPDGLCGVYSLRKKFAVKSLGDAPTIHSPAHSKGHQQDIHDSAFSRPSREHPASSGELMIDDQDELQQRAVSRDASTSGHDHGASNSGKTRSGYSSTCGHLPERHVSTNLSLSNRVSFSDNLELEADHVESSSSEQSDALSECSEEASLDDDEEGVAGVPSLRLHPAHPCAQLTDQAKEDTSLACRQLVSMPGCSTAKQLAEAAAKDPLLGATVKNFDFAVLQGKLFGTTECTNTIEVDLVCSEIASASSQSQPQHCIIAVVPRSQQPKSPAQRKPLHAKTRSSMRGPKEAVELAGGWLFTCPTNASGEILDLFGQNGAVRLNLDTCFKLRPDAKAGSGTFGSVIRASCAKKPGQEVAVKVMNTVKESAIQSEISMLVAAQGSPAIVKFLSAFYDECPYSGSKSWALAFEGYPGDLYDRVAVGKRMMEDDAMPLMQDLLSAISFLQDRNIFHRDIKPENLLMTTAGGVVLTDFGMATHLNNLQDRVSERGTVGYSSPEMLNGTATGYEGDNFGAGIVMYFMLSKSTPFLAPTTELMIEKTNACIVNMAYKCFDHLSQDCRNLTLGLIRFHPHDRLTMAKALGCNALFRKFKTVTEPNLQPLPRNFTVRPRDANFSPERSSGDLPFKAPSLGELPHLRRVPARLAQKNISKISQ